MLTKYNEENMMQNIVDERKRRKLDRKITGVIQEDRIWEQWYDKDIFDKPLPKMSQKDYLFQCINEDRNRVIIDNRGMKTFTVSQFDKYVIKFQLAFANMYLKKGDVICTIGLTTPELYAIKYAATSLGLVTCNLNIFDVASFDDGKNRLYEQIKIINPKMIFVLDLFEDKVLPVLNDYSFGNIVKVIMPLSKSTPIYNPERYLLALKTLKEHLSGKKIKKAITLDAFLSLDKYKNKEDLEEIYEENLACNIAFTSGTTGINKAVLLSHDANNALAYQHKIGNFQFKKYAKNLALIPPFLAFCIVAQLSRQKSKIFIMN